MVYILNHLNSTFKRNCDSFGPMLLDVWYIKYTNSKKIGPIFPIFGLKLDRTDCH